MMYVGLCMHPFSVYLPCFSARNIHTLLSLHSIATGQSVDDHVMREILVDLLTAVGKETLLRENGGKIAFSYFCIMLVKKTKKV